MVGGWHITMLHVPNKTNLFYLFYYLQYLSKIYCMHLTKGNNINFEIKIEDLPFLSKSTNLLCKPQTSVI